MASTIRLDDTTKAHLDELQARVRLKTGSRMSHAELVARMMEYVTRREKAFYGEVEWRPFTPEEIKALLRLPVKTGRKGRFSEEVDEVVYGREAVFGRRRT